MTFLNGESVQIFRNDVNVGRALKTCGRMVRLNTVGVGAVVEETVVDASAAVGSRTAAAAVGVSVEERNHQPAGFQSCWLGTWAHHLKDMSLLEPQAVVDIGWVDAHSEAESMGRTC